MLNIFIRKYLTVKQLTIMSTVITFSQFKGGSLKTTSTFNVAFALAKKGYKVLAIDLIPQAHLTYYAGIPEEQAEEHSIYETLTDLKPLQMHEVTTDTGTVDFCASHISVEFAVNELINVSLGELRLKKAVDKIKDNYDFVLIDTPPSLGILTQSALIASDYVFIPTPPEFMPTNGLSKQLESLDSFKRNNDLGFEIKGVFMAKFDQRKNLNKDVSKAVKEQLGDLVMESIIRENVSLAETSGLHTDIFTYSPRSHGAEDYENLTREILRRINK